jgi:hypothetical protein
VNNLPIRVEVAAYAAGWSADTLVHLAMEFLRETHQVDRFSEYVERVAQAEKERAQ